MASSLQLGGAPPGPSSPFEDVWSRREELIYDANVRLSIPSIDDLILTKRWAMRDKDVADIRFLERLKRSKGEPDAT